MFTNAIPTQINFSNALAKENEKRTKRDNTTTTTPEIKKKTVRHLLFVRRYR